MPTSDLETKLEAVERALVETRRSNEQRVLWLAIAGGTAVLAGVIGIAIGLAGVNTAGDARDTLAEFLAERTESRAVSCQAENNTAERLNALNATVGTIVQSVNTPNPDRSPEQQAVIDHFIAQALDELEHALVPLRDCSPEGIADYFENNATTVPEGDR